MALNPSERQKSLDSPMSRMNPLNDPGYSQDSGYNTYDLNNGQALSPRFGEFTPSTVFETVPGDRHLVTSNKVTRLNQIDANLYSRVNEYHDYVYTPMRCIYPINYEKIIINPTKGNDVPDKALPMIPLLQFLRQMIDSDAPLSFELGGSQYSIREYFNNFGYDESFPHTRFFISQVLYVAYALSAGNLLDYLGYSLDVPGRSEVLGKNIPNLLQEKIDDLFNFILSVPGKFPSIRGFNYNTSSMNGLATNVLTESAIDVQYIEVDERWTLSDFRGALYDCFERGLVIDISYENEVDIDGLFSAVFEFRQFLLDEVLVYDSISLEDDADPFNLGFMNPSRLAAYQLAVAEFGTNDTVDNIFTAELYMQNLRAIMFPSRDDISQEPTFRYNGVTTEYDLLTTGAFEYSFFDEGNQEGVYIRSIALCSALLFLRRSLRYGDYFSTGRPNLLAVGNLAVPVNDGVVSPIDMNKGLVMQRFLNAVNRIGMRFVNYITSLFNVKPSDTGCHPYFIGQITHELGRDTVTNTAGDQGSQTTNLVGADSNYAMDVFIDDYGVIVGMVSYDALPYYTSGIDANFRNSDRFSLFNSMLQNVGDQTIQKSELTGIVKPEYEGTFAYTVRYAQYKYGVSRAHGAFKNRIKYALMTYPWRHFPTRFPDMNTVRISPDFIRDKPQYFDKFFAQRSGMSPADYYHFEIVVTNQHSAARKMQYQPGVL